MKKHFLHFLWVISLICTFASCTKYVAGPKGETGSAGGAGNLVLKQFSITINSSDWSQQEATWIVEIFSDQITQTVLEEGEVKVYIQVDNAWWSLPYGKDYIFTQSTVQLGKIRLVREHIHGGVPLLPATANYRVVIHQPAN